MPGEAPDTAIGMGMPAAKGGAAARVTFKVGTVRDDVERGNPVPEGKDESVDLAGLGVRIVEGVGGVEHATENDDGVAGCSGGDRHR